MRYYNIIKNIPTYKNKDINPIFNKSIDIIKLKAEFNNHLVKGSGVFLIKNVIDNKIIEETNNTINNIIQTQKKPDNDHFSDNLRIWNFYEKFCIKNPQLFINYHKNPLFNIIFQSYLGPKYEVTSQINIVKPNSKSQIFHRDYHLGLMELHEILKYPLNIQESSKNLSLQALICHTPMDKLNGSTKLIPFSQKNKNGYIDIKSQEEIEKCGNNFVQLDTDIGDIIIFSPAVYHAAGSNRATSNRIGNILQINSAFSKPMEIVDKKKIQTIVERNIKHCILNDLEKECIYEIVTNNYVYPQKLDN